ncbi:hypothetical protein KR52_13800 [Synechococcus sp. KORDI-52]|nr:hypothetical protein KR52_13800 [Synechococcus sp. KORDI-52]
MSSRLGEPSVAAFAVVRLLWFSSDRSASRIDVAGVCNDDGRGGKLGGNTG